MATTSGHLKIKPLAGYILVEQEKGETKTASGIVLPDNVQERPAQGKVLAVGDDFAFESGKVIHCPVKVSDRVVYKKWGGDEIKVDGKEYKLVKFEDLMAVIEG